MLAGCVACSPPTAPDRGSPSGSTTPQPVVGVPVLGSVHDWVMRPIAGAKVEVVGGSGTGASATTDASGLYQLPGTFTGTVGVRASKDGYLTKTQSYTPERWNQSARLAFYLETLTPALDVTGEYTLTFTAASACTQLPAAARERTYGADITRATTSTYLVGLKDATFYSSTFPLVVVSNVARFWVDEYGDYGPFVEFLTPSTSLMLTHDIFMSVGESNVLVPFSGTFSYCSNASGGPAQWPQCAVPPVECTASSHTFSLVRR
jgi:hypothetical protein